MVDFPDDESGSERPTLVPAFDVEAFARKTGAPSAPRLSDEPRAEMPTMTNEVELEAARVASTFDSAPPSIEIEVTDLSDDVTLATYEVRFGSFARVPVIVMSAEEVGALALDHRAGVVLAWVDGARTVQTILDVSGMSPLDALAILQELLDRRIIRMR